MFGNASQPSRIYRYYCRAPLLGGEIIADQMWRAHRYRNALVELEHKRRDGVADLVRALSAPVVETEAAWKAADERAETMAAELRKGNQKARAKRDTQEQRAALREARAEAKRLYQELKTAKRDVYDSPEFKGRSDTIEADANAARKAARAESGLYWGTYLAVEQSCGAFRSGRPPVFRSWHGDGKIAVQIQNGLPWTDALLGIDPRLSVQIQPLTARPTHNKRGKPLPQARMDSPRRLRDARAIVTIRLAVGEDEDGIAVPVLIKIPICLHRMPPPDSKVKWIYLHRRWKGTRANWSLCFVLAREAWETIEGGPEIAGMDVGWRKVRDGLRVAYIVGSDGHEEQVRLDADHVDRWAKADSIRAIRDENFNQFKARFAEWGRAVKDRVVLTQLVAERLKTLHAVRSAERLRAFVKRWAAERFAGDYEMFADAQAWADRDAHLHNYEVGIRADAIAKRDHYYRIVAHGLATRYGRLAVEKTNWRELTTKKPTGAEEDAPDAMRRMARIAAVGTLLQFVKEKVAQIELRDAPYTTTRCHACGTNNQFDAARDLFFTCSGCGMLHDQDRNAAINLRDGLRGPTCAGK